MKFSDQYERDIELEDELEELLRRRKLIDAGELAKSQRDIDVEDQTEEEMKAAIANQQDARKRSKKNFEDALASYNNYLAKPKPKRPTNSVWEASPGEYMMTWTHAPAYLKAYMPSKQEPATIYREITSKMIRNLLEAGESQC